VSETWQLPPSWRFLSHFTYHGVNTLGFAYLYHLNLVTLRATVEPDNTFRNATAIMLAGKHDGMTARQSGAPPSKLKAAMMSGKPGGDAVGQ